MNLFSPYDMAKMNATNNGLHVAKNPFLTTLHNSIDIYK